ncbi:MAG: delta-60 repeat domain-containing protein [Tahibacter sp.]
MALLSIAVEAQVPAPLPQVNVDLKLNGVVNAIVRQDDGGIVLGGHFSSVNGVPRRNIARLQPDGNLDFSWQGQSDGEVFALAVGSGGTILVGGDFNQLNGQPRLNIGKLSGTTGALDPAWDPHAGFAVRALAADRLNAVYAGGDFPQIGGVFRSGVAKLFDAGAGTADPDWDLPTNGPVFALALRGSSLYVGGTFTEINGESRSGIGKLTAVSPGLLDPNWNPSANGSVLALSVATSGDVFAGGNFNSIGGLLRNHLAKLSDNGAGSVDPNWDPSPSDIVHAIQIDSSVAVFVGGAFSSAGGIAREHIAKLAYAGNGSADVGWNPSISHRVLALAPGASGAVLAGGDFNTVGGQIRLGFSIVNASGAAGAAVDTALPAVVSSLAVQPGGGVVVAGQFVTANGLLRRNLLRLSPTGALDPIWNPSANDSVFAIAADGDAAVYVGGRFTQAGGQPRDFIAKLSGGGDGAADTGWNPSSESWVYALAVEPGAALYAGGAFHSIGGQSRSAIAKLSTSGNGAVDVNWNPFADSIVTSLVLGPENSLFAGGRFDNIGGRAIRQVAKLSRVGTGAADATWNAPLNASVDALAPGHSGEIYMASKVCFLGGQFNYCPLKIAGSGSGVVDPVWNPSMDFNVVALAVGGDDAVFAGGIFSAVSGLPRRGLVKLSANGQVDLSWRPGVDGVVYALATSATGVVYVGGQFSGIGGQPRSSLAALPVATPDSIYANGFQNDTTISTERGLAGYLEWRPAHP